LNEVHDGPDLRFRREVDPVDQRPHEADPPAALGVQIAWPLGQAGEDEAVPLSITEMAQRRLANSTVTW
jgi:hypothetical protein